MFKLTQLLHKGRQVKELKEIQIEKERTQEELDNCSLFPKWYDYDSTRNYITKGTPRELSDMLSLIFTGRAHFETLEKYCDHNFKLESAQDFF